MKQWPLLFCDGGYGKRYHKIGTKRFQTRSTSMKKSTGVTVFAKIVFSFLNSCFIDPQTQSILYRGNGTSIEASVPKVEVSAMTTSLVKRMQLSDYLAD